MSGKWKCLVSEYLGIDVDVSILEANDFLMAQIGVLMKIMEDNDNHVRRCGHHAHQIDCGSCAPLYRQGVLSIAPVLVDISQIIHRDQHRGQTTDSQT